MGKKSVYAVVRGRQPGLYRSWEECSAQVKGFKGNIYKGFGSEGDARRYLEDQGVLEISGRQPFGARALHSSSGDGENPETVVPAKNRATIEQPLIDNDVDEDDEAEVPSNGINTNTPSIRQVRVEFDGASKNNPGPAGYGAVLYDTDSGKEVKRLYRYMGDRYTNNQAEYAGMIAGIQAAFDLGIKNVIVQGDSMLIVNQVLGLWKVKNEGLMPYHRKAVGLSKKFESFAARQVPRAENAVADALSNQAIDEYRQGVGVGKQWVPPSLDDDLLDDDDDDQRPSKKQKKNSSGL